MATARLKQRAAEHTAVMVEPPKDLRAETKQYVLEMRGLEYNIAENLSKIYREEQYKEWGYESFEQYVNTELAQHGLYYQKARSLVNISQNVLERFHITPKDLTKYPWTAMKELAGAVADDTTKEEFTGWLKETKDMTVDEVEKFSRKKKIIRVGGTHKTVHILRYAVSEDELNVIEKADDLVRQLTGIESVSQLRVYRDIEWTANHNPELAKAIAQMLPEEVKTERAPQKKRADKVRKEGKYGKGVRSK